jgi:hypothetical protein
VSRRIPYTKKCVRCMKRPAEVWGGHVITKTGGPIIAGWCRPHLHFAEESAGAWFGQWRREMGRIKEIF